METWMIETARRLIVALAGTAGVACVLSMLIPVVGAELPLLLMFPTGIAVASYIAKPLHGRIEGN